MPKRVGHLYEVVVSLENCVIAEKEMVKNKRKNRKAKRIKENAEEFGERLLGEIEAWEPSESRKKTIYDAGRGKYRDLEIPCLLDQAVHHAVMRVTIPYIMARNYYYNCGSIPGAGQKRATKAMKRWQGQKKRFKYAEIIDIEKFYAHVKHEDVMEALRRIFKDEKFLALHQKILNSMGKDGVGLAIGFYPSAWYANIVLSGMDRKVKQAGIKCAMVRYADDVVILCNSKRSLRKIHRMIEHELGERKMNMKKNWQIFRASARDVQFLSYRFFRGWTIMRKRLMLRIARRIRRAARRMTLRAAAGVMSVMGILRHCNSYNFRKKWVYSKISIKKCREVISNHARKNTLQRVPEGVQC